MADYLNIAGRVRTTASDGVAMEAQEVKDLSLNKSQQEINADVQTELGNRYTKEETYSKEQLDDLITTPDVNHVSVVATDATTAVTEVLPSTGEANTIYRVGNWNGTQYDPTMYALFAWNGSAYVCLAVRSFVGEVYDISVNHPDGQGNPTPYADLSAALGTDGANIPADIRSGGMRIQFIQGTVQSSDNEYVQYRLIADEFTTDVTKWAIDDGGVYLDNHKFVYVKIDAKGKILYGVKQNGEFFFGAGCPQQVKDYIEKKISSLSLDEYEDIVTFLSDYLGSDTTLKVMIDGINAAKVDKEEGKSLIDAEYADGLSQIEDSEFVRIVTDANDRILYGVKKNGDFYFGAGVPSIIQEHLIDFDKKLTSEIRILTSEIEVLTIEKVSKEEGKSLINADFANGISIVDSSEIVDIKLDGDGRIIELTKKDGTKVLYSGLKVKGNIHSDPVDFEINEDNSFSSVELDKDGRIISAVRKDGKEYFKENVENYIPQYSKLLDAMRDDYYKPFLLGSQLVQANTSSYDKVLGQQNTFNADKLIKQFNYIGLDGKLPNMKMGRLQKIMIGDVQATILYMGTYIYAVTDGNGIVYRMPYSKLSIITENNTDIDSISISLDNMIIDGVYETNDGNFLIQVYDSTSPDTYPTRSLYKVTLDGELNATVSAEPVIVCVQSTTNIVGVREHWSFKQYGAMILISPYGSGRTGQVWLSRDYGNSFDCIFNVANDTTYVATKPNGQGGYGAYGIHPLPSLMLPPQGDDFWNNVSSIGNGSKHIHSLCYDEEFERIWLVTGDDKYLATGIYWSDDMGKTWHRKSLVFNYPDIDCGTTTQMLQVVSMKNCVLFGTDGWGNGIFRYNRGKKEDEPVLEFVFGWDANRDNLYGIASHNIVTSDGIMLMVFAANSDAALPRGGVVASDGYHFNKIFIDTYSDGVTLASQKIGWPSFVSVNDDNLYIRTKNKNEIVLIEKYNY